MTDDLSRRAFLLRSGVIGCSLAASPLMTPLSFAATPWDTRLVVIILRGGMDGLDVVRPVGDPAFAALRPSLAQGDGIDLDGYFALHPALQPLMPMWDAGQLAFVHAVSTPYRNKRSHFDGQDTLEAGTPGLDGTRDGWLNRMLQAVPGITDNTAYAIGRGEMKLLNGAAPVANWSPEANLNISSQAVRLMDLVTRSDPEMHAALMEAQMLSEASDTELTRRAPPHVQIAEFAAARLREDARIAAFSLNGWDTHHGQHRALPRALGTLAETLTTLKARLRGNIWKKTAVIAMTEFGRTVRENGTRGTDHGTGGVMVLAGGTIRGGRVYGAWPGLDEHDLLDRRDLLPTGDVRAYAAWAMRGLLGVDRAALQGRVFPGVEMGDDPGLIL